MYNLGLDIGCITEDICYEYVFAICELISYMMKLASRLWMLGGRMVGWVLGMGVE